MAAHRRVFVLGFMALLALTLIASSSSRVLPTDSSPPPAPSDLQLVVAQASSLTVAWSSASADRWVRGFRVWLDGAYDGTTRRTSYKLTGLHCGQSYVVGVATYDVTGQTSSRATTTVATAACRDEEPPSTPIGFRQEFTTASSAVVSWNPSSDNLGVVTYGVYAGGLLIATAHEPGFAFANLPCATTSMYEIDAADAAGNRSLKAPVAVRTSGCSDTSPPTAPQPVTVVGVSATSVDIAWPAATDDVGVQRYSVHVGSTKVLTTTLRAATVSGLTCGTSYLIGIGAEDLAGNRSAVATTTAVTRACSSSGSDAQPPSAPSDLRATTATQSTVGLAWTPSTDNVGVSRYTVYRDGAPVGSSTSPAYTLAGLVCGTTYLVAVDASDAAGNRSARTQTYLSTTACADVTSPTGPAEVILASRTQTSISVSWPAATDNVGVAGYGIYKGGTQIASVAETAHTLTGLICGTNYTIGVDAYDGAGNRSPQKVVMVATSACGDTTPPSAPTNLATSGITQTSVTLSWSGSSDNIGVVGYDVSRNGVKIASANGLTAVQDSLTCGTSYTFTVAAYDAAGNHSAAVSKVAGTLGCGATSSTPRIASSISNGATITAGTNWTVGVEPAAERVEFWADGAKMSEDATVPFETRLDLAPGAHALGLCPWIAGVRLCQSVVSSGVFANVTVSQPQTAAVAAPGGANLWVDANGGTCQRAAALVGYADAGACGSLTAAHAAAAPGDTVRLKGGSYGDVTLTADKGSPAVTVKSADGETVTLGTVTVAAGAGWITLDGLRMDSYILGPTITGAGASPPAAHDLALLNIDANTFLVNRAERVKIGGGDYGPAHHRKPTIAVSNPWDSYAPTDVVVENARFHDITMDPGGEHVECILVYAGERVSIRGNSFQNCEGTGDVAVLFLRGTGYRPHLANIAVEGNSFSSEGDPQVDSTAAWFNVQADPCVPGLRVASNTAPKGIYYTTC